MRKLILEGLNVIKMNAISKTMLRKPLEVHTPLAGSPGHLVKASIYIKHIDFELGWDGQEDVLKIWYAVIDEQLYHRGEPISMYNKNNGRAYELSFLVRDYLQSHIKKYFSEKVRIKVTECR